MPLHSFRERRQRRDDGKNGRVLRNWSRNATNLIIASQRLKNELKTYMCFLNPFQTRNRFEGTRSEVEELMTDTGGAVIGVQKNPGEYGVISAKG